MSIATVLINDIEVGAEDALKWVEKEQKATPPVLGALAVVAGKVENVLAGGASAAETEGLNFSLDAAEVKAIVAVWPATKAFLLTLGIRV